LLEQPPTERVDALAAVCARHPERAAALRSYIADLLAAAAAIDATTPAGAQAAPGPMRAEALAETTTSPAGTDDHPTEIGPYRVLAVIGQGGMGTVYLAEQREPVRRRVALKVIKLGMDTKEVLARFQAERQALAMMEHGNIARVFDAGATAGGRPYFAMEYVKGLPLTAYCDLHKLALPARLELLQQVCAGIQHAHTKGVIHRDLKPSNVLVSVVDGQPRVKIIDFGLARATDHRLTAATLFTEQGQILGTPEYMSPEQAGLGGLDIDTRTDVYALGVLLYELLTGTLPFPPTELRKAGLLEVQRVIREDDPPRPSTRLSSLGPTREQVARHRSVSVSALLRQLRTDLDWVVMKALEKDRTRRYETASELAADIGRFVRGEAVVACPPSLGYRVRKFVRRYRGQVAAVTTVFVAVIAGAIVAIVQYLRAERHAAAASASAATAEQEAAAAAAAREEAQHVAKDARRQLYYSEILGAETALSQGEVESARKHLAQAPQEYRGWEWGYLTAMTDGSIVTLGGGEERVYAAWASPDGRRVFTGAYGNVSMWDAKRGVRQWRLDARGQAIAAFRPDGLQIVCALSSDVSPRIYDAATGKELGGLRGHQGRVSQLAFSDDGTRVATVGEDQTTRIWETSTRTEVQQLRGSFTGAVFSPDGSRVLTISPARRVVPDWTTTVHRHDWDPPKGLYGPDPRPFGMDVDYGCHSNERVDALFLSDDERGCGAAVGDHEVTIWSFPTLTRLAGFVTHMFSDAGSPLSANGRRVVVGLEGGATVFEVDYEATSRIADLPFRQSDALIATVAIDREGSRVFAIYGNGGDWVASVWDVAHQREIAVLAASKDTTCACFSPDGSSVALGSRMGPLEIWDIASREVRATLRGHEAPVRGVSFSSDGNRILSVEDHAARIWDLATGESRVLRAGDSSIQSAVFSGDGRTVDLCCGDLWQRWDVTTAQRQREERLPTLDPRFCARAPNDPVAINAKGYTVFVTTPQPHQEQTALVWDVAAGFAVSTLRYESICSASFLPHGDIITAALDGATWLWDGSSVHRDKQDLELPDLELLPAGRPTAWTAFGPDRTVMLAPSAANTATVWNIDPSRPTRGNAIAKLGGHNGEVTGAAFSADGSRIVTASLDRTARVWDARTGSPIAELRGHTKAVDHAAINADGSVVVTQSADGTARVWDGRAGPGPIVLRGTGDTFSISSDGTRIVTGSTGAIRVWDTLTGTQTAELLGTFQSARAMLSRDGRILTDVPGSGDLHDPVPFFSLWDGTAAAAEVHHARWIAHSLSPEGDRVVVLESSDKLGIFDLAAGRRTVDLAREVGDLDLQVIDASFSSDGARVVTVHRDSTVRLWDAASGAQLVVLKGEGARAAVFSPDGCRILLTLKAGQQLLDASTGGPIAIPGVLRQAAFSRDGSAIVTLDGDTARVLDTSQWVELAVLRGHEGWLHTAMFSPDGTRIVTGSDDQTARVWDARSGNQVAVLRGHERQVTTVQWSADGTRIVTGDGQGTVRIWDSVPHGTRVAERGGATSGR